MGLGDQCRVGESVEGGGVRWEGGIGVVWVRG